MNLNLIKFPKKEKCKRLPLNQHLGQIKWIKKTCTESTENCVTSSPLKDTIEPLCSSTLLGAELPASPELPPSPAKSRNVIYNFAEVEDCMDVMDCESDLETIGPTEPIAAKCVFQEMLPKAKAVVSSLQVLDPCYEPWQILGFIDAEVTSSILDNCFVTSHKLCIHENIETLLSLEKYRKMRDIILKSYVQSMEWVSYIPIPVYGVNPQYTELAVVSSKKMKSKTTIEG